jgi:hypothetical protein
MGSPSHIGIFVEMGESGAGTGRVFQVVGSIFKGGGGMRFEDKRAHNPVDSTSYARGKRMKVGNVKVSDLDRFRAVCQSILVPGPQVDLNGSRMDKARMLRRCTGRRML